VRAAAAPLRATYPGIVFELLRVNATNAHSINLIQSNVMNMDTLARRLSTLLLGILLSACATQTPPVQRVEAPQSLEAQRIAQQKIAAAPPAKPTLKRKIALGRVSNETIYGRSLLRDSQGDPLGKQVGDMLSKALTESGQFLVLERPDIGRIKNESELAGTNLNLVGADELIVGSLTEFGRKVVGETGFLSATKKQVAFAKMDIRLVDTRTARIVFSASGAGESSTESASVAGFGSQAAYDGTLNDSAIRQAVSEVVNKLSTELMGRPWRTYFLSIEGPRAYIAGGKSQGIRPGMSFTVETLGQRVKSPQTGFEITLPGKQVAEIRVESTFGDTETNEGSIVTVVSGRLDASATKELVVLAKE
jgi:curli biogenesis system outer membrane secretion channel CsgG